MQLKFLRTAILGTAAVFLLALWPSHAAWVDFSTNLLASVEKRWGREAPTRLRVVQRLVRDNQAAVGRGQPEAPVLRQVNGFLNQVPYVNDIKHWGLEDYWATPAEMLGSFGGDCEDYSIGKYLSLKQIGIPIEKLRITYVRALRLGEAHMVLAYYPTPDADPLILDNLINDIRPASQRTDLEPVYSFNDDDLWLSGGMTSKGGASNVRLWRDLLDRLAREQQL
nr:transglutaminase-like cysteine peptidase [uncultured Rhodoferax sp.]